MEAPGTAPGSERLITTAFIAIAGRIRHDEYRGRRAGKKACLVRDMERRADVCVCKRPVSMPEVPLPLRSGINMGGMRALVLCYRAPTMKRALGMNRGRIGEPQTDSPVP